MNYEKKITTLLERKKCSKMILKGASEKIMNGKLHICQERFQILYQETFLFRSQASNLIFQ